LTAKKSVQEEDEVLNKQQQNLVYVFFAHEKHERLFISIIIFLKVKATSKSKA